MILTPDNFIEYAFEHYNNPDQTDPGEFHDDLSKMKYIKRLLIRAVSGKATGKEPLIVNHMKMLFNLFGVEPATNMLLFRIDEPELQPMLMELLNMANSSKN